jgi:hypothetical protein
MQQILFAAVATAAAFAQDTVLDGCRVPWLLRVPWLRAA